MQTFFSYRYILQQDHALTGVHGGYENFTPFKKKLY